MFSNFQQTVERDEAERKDRDIERISEGRGGREERQYTGTKGEMSEMWQREKKKNIYIERGQKQENGMHVKFGRKNKTVRIGES